MEIGILLILYIALPAVAIYLCDKFEFLNRIGTVVLCYVFGLILGPLGASEQQYYLLQEIVMQITVPLAIPLLLFTSNVKDWKKLASKPFYSLVFALLAVLIAVSAGYYIVGGSELPGFNKVGGMLVGIYSGGTPNLASLKLALDVDEEVYLAVHSYDMAIGAVYLFVLMGFGQRLFQLVLPKYDSGSVMNQEEQVAEMSLRDLIVKKVTRRPLLKILLLAIVLVAIAGGVMMLVPESIQMVVFIFLITAFGIVGSSVKRIHTTVGTFDLGMYLILIFSVVVSSKVHVGNFTDVNPAIFAYITFVVFVSLFLHVLFSSMKKIDSDTVIITSAALICSPPFVPVLAGALRNREVIVPGLTIGLIGYAVGNYLGYAMAILLNYL